MSRLQENVNCKIEEMKVDVSKEINELLTYYYSILSKVDIIATAVMNFVQTFQSLLPKVEAKANVDVLNFEKLGALLGEIKGLVSKFVTTSSLTHEFLTQKFNSLEEAIQKAVAPMSKFLSFLPTSSPPIFTGMQGGEKEKVGKEGKVSKCEKEKVNKEEHKKVKTVGKVI